MGKLKMSYRFPGKAKFIVMQNHFICKSSIYIDYIKTVLEPAMSLLDEMPMASEVVEYRESRTMKIKDGYTYKPFICEKLFTAYLEEKNYNCKQW